MERLRRENGYVPQAYQVCWFYPEEADFSQCMIC